MIHPIGPYMDCSGEKYVFDLLDILLIRSTDDYVRLTLKNYGNIRLVVDFDKLLSDIKNEIRCFQLESDRFGNFIINL